MQELYHRIQCMMANPNIGDSAILLIPNGDGFLPFPGFQFGGNELDTIRYHAPQGLDMDILHHVGTLDGVGLPVYSSMTETEQQQAILSHNTQSSTTDIGEESLPCREAIYRDQRTGPLTPAYASSPQSTNFDHRYGPVIAIGSASPCLQGQTIIPAALADTDVSDVRNSHARSSVAASCRDETGSGPTVLSFISSGIRYYRCDVRYVYLRL
ncbi:hypothetical protein JOM56_013625 [Amanita muscaria]